MLSLNATMNTSLFLWSLCLFEFTFITQSLMLPERAEHQSVSFCSFYDLTHTCPCMFALSPLHGSAEHTMAPSLAFPGTSFLGCLAHVCQLCKALPSSLILLCPGYTLAVWKPTPGIVTTSRPCNFWSHLQRGLSKDSPPNPQLSRFFERISALFQRHTVKPV